MPDFDRFCIYCQIEYASVANLHRHIVRKHKDTHAYWNVVPEEMRLTGSPP